MKILVFIPVWKRPEITKACYESLKRTIIAAPSHLQFVVLITASTEEDRKLAENAGFRVFMCDNFPLGRKFNAGLEYALSEWNWDYLMQLNSDDVLSTDFWPTFEDHFSRKLYFFGVDRVYFYNSANRDMRHFQYGGGCGIRFIRRDIVEKAGFVDDQFALWDDDLNSGLDNNSSLNILHRARRMQHFARRKDGRPVVVDIKSKINIHSFLEFRNAPRLDPEHRAQVMRRFPELKVFDERFVKIEII